MKKFVFLLCAILALNVAACSRNEEKATQPGATQSVANQAAAYDDYVVKIGYATAAGLCSAPFFIADVNGYFTDEGLKYESIKIDSSQIPQLLTAGTIDATNLLLATTIQPLVNGLDIKIPLAIHTGCIKVLVAPDSDIKTPADLKGKRIGTAGMGAPPTIIVQRYLAELGIGTVAPNLEVEWVIYPMPDLPLALERGQVDAIAVSDPIALITENSGKGRVIINTTSDPQMKDEFCCVLVAGSKVTAEHTEAIAKLTRAVQKASVWVQNNPAETARLIAEHKYVAGDPQVNAEALSLYNWHASVSEAKTALQRNLTDLQKINLVPQSINIDALVNKTFVTLPGVPDTL
jgi:NitT/TauT family transport system substrate-binding protein